MILISVVCVSSKNRNFPHNFPHCCKAKPTRYLQNDHILLAKTTGEDKKKIEEGNDRPKLWITLSSSITTATAQSLLKSESVAVLFSDDNNYYVVPLLRKA